MLPESSKESRPKFFPTLNDWRAWLEQHHADTENLWVGFYKRDSGRPSITWPESVDGALCFGWIDGVRKSIDEISYKIRFTPRKPRSVWSAVNIKRAKELTKLGMMHAAGLAAFKKRNGTRSEIYSYEQRKNPQFSPELESRFRKNKAAWEFFQSRAPWYRRTCTYWVLSAKKEETREKRFTALLDCSTRKKAIPQLERPGKN